MIFPRFGFIYNLICYSMWNSGMLFYNSCSYVSAMVPVKSPKEYYVQQEVIVLFCETVER